MKNDTSIGQVYFKEDEGIHHYGFIQTEDQKAVKGFTNRTRVVYLIVSDEESKFLNGKEEDKDIILENIKNKYQEHLIKAVEEESKKENRNITSYELKGLEEKVIDKKLVKLSTLQLHTSKSYGNVLKSKNYTHAYNNKLDEKHKKNTEVKTSGMLDFNKNKSQEILNKEKKKNTDEDQAYIIVSMPYVYNIKKDSQIEELELEYYENRVSASFMPELIVEYGVFFDGTNNNIYNIDFYKNFSEFLKEPARYIEKNKGKVFRPKPNDYDYNSIQDYILSEENPELSDEVKKLIINQIDNAPKDIRYFDENSNLDLEEKEVLNSTKATHASKVFTYFKDIKEGNQNSKQETISTFVRENILVEDDEDSSYTNGESNISRLYNLYDGDDIKRNIDLLPTTRFKLYESGAGTSNPFINKDYGEDSLFGAGLGGVKYFTTDKTGILAHIVYSCIKIAEQLRASSISYIDELVLDVFGFSRGAATARHFVCSILNEAELIEKANRDYSVKTKDNKNMFSVFFEDVDCIFIDGKRYFNPLVVEKQYYGSGRSRLKNPYYKMSKITIESLSFRFVGIYDTVPHFGISQSNDHKNLNLNFFENDNNKKVGQVVHLMADDEYRFNFDAYSIFSNKNKLVQKFLENSPSVGSKFEEFHIPGAHSDVGGGYNVSYETTLIHKENILLSNQIPSNLEDKLEDWNDKYKWLKTYKLIQVNSKKDITNSSEDAFYYFTTLNYNTKIPKSILSLYMHKKTVSNKYEYLSLNLMHDRAIYKDITKSKAFGKKDEYEMVPFASLKAYTFSNEQILVDSYKELRMNNELEETKKELYSKLKDKFLHHSSKYGDFVNKPSKEDKDSSNFYGRRVIYTSSGEKFTKK